MDMLFDKSKRVEISKSRAAMQCTYGVTMTLHFIHIKPGFRFILSGSMKAAVRKEVVSMGKKNIQGRVG